MHIQVGTTTPIEKEQDLLSEQLSPASSGLPDNLQGCVRCG